MMQFAGGSFNGGVRRKRCCTAGYCQLIFATTPNRNLVLLKSSARKVKRQQIPPAPAPCANMRPSDQQSVYRFPGQGTLPLNAAVNYVLLRNVLHQRLGATACERWASTTDVDELPRATPAPSCSSLEDARRFILAARSSHNRLSGRCIQFS